MGLSFEIYEKYKFFVSSWIGTISDSDLLLAYKDLFEDIRYKPGFHEIADMREADLGNVTSDGVHRLSKMVEQYLTGKCDYFKTAVIAPEDLSFGMSRVYEIISNNSPEEVMVFRELDEALEWMGVDESYLK